MRGFFIGPILVTVAGLALSLYTGGFALLFTVIILSVLEVTLSFDNAIINASVLRRMSEKWQKRFLLWGILVAVVGTRLILPVIIVSIALVMSPLEVARLAWYAPAQYGELLHAAHYGIGAFGGVFLLMVALKYFFDETKDLHWIEAIERHMVRWGSIEAIEVVIALALLVGVSFLVPAQQSMILVAGIVGVIVFTLMQGITSSMEKGAHHLATAGFGAFMYLEVLDTAFSLDGVVGAFALTTNLLAITVGLGIGAYFVRTLTIVLVRSHALRTLPYLTHGAHWAIMGLALTMIVGLVIDVPEVITGTIGLIFVGASYWTSLTGRKRLS